MKIPKKQKEVLQMLYDGMSIKEIAYQLGKKQSTICTHKNRLLKKFNCCNIKELLALRILELKKENQELKNYKDMWQFYKKILKEGAEENERRG